MDRSLGIIVYSDGSQAEVRLARWQSSFTPEGYQDVVVFHPLKKPRRLTLAPFGLLVGLALFVLSGCVSLPIRGDKPICLLDYKTGVKACEYDTWQACHADLRPQTMCYHR